VISLGNVQSVRAFGLEITPGDRVLVGAVGSPSGDNGANSFGLIARLTNSGRPDRDFGDGGSRLLDGRINVVSGSVSLARAADGGFAVAGYSYDGAPHFAVSRYAPDASLITAFGDGGIVRDTFDPSRMVSSAATAVTIDSAGRVLVAGGFGSGYGFARLLPDGSLDPSFAGDGRTVEPASSGLQGFPVRVFSLADGGILAVGSMNDPQPSHGGCPTFVSVRLTAGGGLDPAFGDAGVATQVEQCAAAADAAVGPNGTFTIAGSPFNYFDLDGGSFRIVRDAADGSLDKSFGTGGRIDGTVAESTPYPPVSDIALAGDGDVLIAGSANSLTCAIGVSRLGNACQAVVIRRMDADGEDASDFGVDGQVAFPELSPGLERSHFRILVAQAMPEVVHARGGRVAVSLRCPAEVRTSCRFDLTLHARAGALIQIKRTRLEAGQAARIKGDTGGVTLGDHGNLRGEVSAPGQDPVDVHARVDIRG
jgi:uncharacterized delta-60 repeat protein